MKTIRFIVVITLLCVSFTAAQKTQTLLQLLEKGDEEQLGKIPPDELRMKIKDAGLSEQEAVTLARQKGINLDKYLQIQEKQVQEQEKLKGKPEEELTAAARGTSEAREIPTGVHGLPFFAYDVFRHVPEAFQPSEVGPIDPGYLIGPGDILRLTVWGQAEFQYELTVDREGRIFIPNVGQIFVMGTPLEKLEQKLKHQMSKYYSGLAASPPTVFLDITIAKLRPLRVFILGEVAQPGGYTISNYATVFNALYAVGGPLPRGSLRNVKVIRESKVIAVVDLYDYLLKGENTSDVRLQNNDVVFIPPRGKTVSIRGEVRRPAIYELKDEEHFLTLLQFCGGLLPTAYTGVAQVERIKPFDQRKTIETKIVVDIPLNDILSKKMADFSLENSDDVEIFPVVDEPKNYAVIRGSVYRPGRYELGKVKTIRDLLSAAEGLLPKTFLDVAYVSRLNPDRITRHIIAFDLGKLVKNNEGDMTLQPRDEVIIISTEATEVKEQFVTITGQVANPGRYPLLQKMTLSDLVLLAGGFLEDADLSEAEVARIRPGGLEGDSLVILLRPTLSNDFIPNKQENDTAGRVETVSANSFVLQHRDHVRIRPNPKFTFQQSVYLAGDITYPGTYSIQKKGETLSSLLTRAGGPTATSYLGGAEFWRNGKRLLVDFEKAFFQKSTIHDPIIFPNDSIYIPSHPHTVTVVGEVNNPGLLSYIKGDDVMDYIDRAGGTTDSAAYAILIKPTGESEKIGFGLFSSNPTVAEGSVIRVLKIPPPAPEDKVNITELVKDTFAILTSAATLAFIVYQVTK